MKQTFKSFDGNSYLTFDDNELPYNNDGCLKSFLKLVLYAFGSVALMAAAFFLVCGLANLILPLFGI